MESLSIHHANEVILRKVREGLDKIKLSLPRGLSITLSTQKAKEGMNTCFISVGADDEGAIILAKTQVESILLNLVRWIIIRMIELKEPG